MRRDQDTQPGGQFGQRTPDAPAFRTHARTCLLMGAGLMSLCVAVAGIAALPGSARAQQTQSALPPSAAAISARQLLAGPRPVPQEMTDRAGIGTGEATPPTRAALPNRPPRAEPSPPHATGQEETAHSAPVTPPDSTATAETAEQKTASSPPVAAIHAGEEQAINSAATLRETEAAEAARSVTQQDATLQSHTPRAEASAPAGGAQKAASPATAPASQPSGPQNPATATPEPTRHPAQRQDNASAHQAVEERDTSATTGPATPAMHDASSPRETSATATQPPSPAGSQATAVTTTAPVRGGTDSAGNAAPTSAPANTAIPAVSTAPALVAPGETGNASTPATRAESSPQPSTAAMPRDRLAPIADAIAAMLTTPENLSATSDERNALFVFYAAREYRPLFVDETGVNTRGADILARLQAAGEDGLNPADYPAARPATGADAAALAQAELDMATAALTYARHAQSGRFNPTRISALVTPTRDIPTPESVLANLGSASNANAALADYNPPHAGYRRLKAVLAASNPTASRQVTVPAGPLLKPGARDMRVPMLRARLGLAQAEGHETVDTDLAYDPELIEAVKSFQESVQLKPTGVVGDATVRALNRRIGGGSSAQADIIANMERWRWLPRDLGTHHVMVNIPEFMLRIYTDEKPIHSTRVVVGKAETPTVLISKPMTYVVVNPAWNIPPSIVRKEMMPALQNNPSALSRRGIEVTRTRSGGYSFRQKPGPNNALGRIKFMFPNDHAIYLHDTPTKRLFANASRAYSHGCVRVQDPLDFGSVLFNLAMDDLNWSEARFTRMFGPKERYINLKRPIPVHLVYFTTTADAQGRLTSFGDVYGINDAVKNRLGLKNRAHMADGASTRKR